MYKYPLSSKQKTITHSWISNKDKPLLIIGKPGTGKSTLANQLLKDYHTICISSDHVKHSGDLIDWIRSSLFKKDILMMCSRNHYKALLIEDFHYFIKHDKHNTSKLLDFMKVIHKNNPIIVVSDEISNKLLTTLQSMSYVLTIRFSLTFYKKISKTKDISYNHGSSYHTVNTNSHGLVTKLDKTYSVNDIVTLLLTGDMLLSDLFRLCSSEYTTISLNMLENIPDITKQFNVLYDIYTSLCTYDNIESKYIDKSFDLDILLLFSCILPRQLIHTYVTLPKTHRLRYNSYVSKSLIQIHNQSVLSQFDYIQILGLIYLDGLGKNTVQEIKEKISSVDFNLKTLDKQIKVYNYYLNKQLTKKIVTNIMKNII